MLHIGLGDQSAINELAVFGAAREDAPPLQPRDDGGDGGLRQLPVGIELLPDLRDSELALIPE